MKRKIKFRGMTEDGEWVYGYLSFIYVNGRNSEGFIYDKLSRIYCQEEAKSYDVYTYSVGQYTGLKDISDVEIYEADIIKRIDSDTKFIVVFDRGKFCTQDSENLHYNLGLLDSISNYSDIIGNIHQNKELLED